MPAGVHARPHLSVPHGAPVAATAATAGPPAAAPTVDIETLVTEDDTPVDMRSEKQQRLLTEPLYSSWSGPGAGRMFLAAANVGVFPEPRNPAIVPDVFVSLDVQVHANFWDKAHRSYFVWEFGKPPELVVEIVSNQKGNEVGRKRRRHAEMGVGYYVIHDPLHQVMDDELRVYRLSGGSYERQESPWFPELRLERQRADEERQRAEHVEQLLAEERRHAEQEHRRAERLAALLRQSGIDPEQE